VPVCAGDDVELCAILKSPSLVMRALSVPTLEFPAVSPSLSVPDVPVENIRSVGRSDLELKSPLDLADIAAP